MLQKLKKKADSKQYQIAELSVQEADGIVATGFHNSNIDYMKENYSSRVKETRSILSKLHMK
jgi:archaellum component FlaC